MPTAVFDDVTPSHVSNPKQTNTDLSLMEVFLQNQVAPNSVIRPNRAFRKSVAASNCCPGILAWNEPGIRTLLRPSEDGELRDRSRDGRRRWPDAQRNRT